MGNNKQHHINGPSSLERRMLCPGSMKMEEHMPETPSKDADEGTMLHERVVTKDMSGLTTEQETSVQKCLDAIEEIDPEHKYNIYHEKELKLIGNDLKVITFGTSDVVIPMDDVVHVIDWKFGRIPVEYAGENIQLACYGAMAMQTFSKPKAIVHLVQPRINRHDIFPFTDADAITATISNIISKCEAGNAELIPDADKQCKYCRAISKCPAVQKETETALATVNESFLSLPPEELAVKYLEFENKLKLANNFLANAKSRIKEIIKENGSCGCLVFKKPKQKKEVKDILQTWDYLKAYLSNDEFLNSCTVSIPKLKDAFVSHNYSKTPETGQKVTKKKLGENFDNIIEDIIEIKEYEPEITTMKGM